MDMTVYPDFDVKAELDRAQSNVDYHKAQVRYFESQVKHLKRARDEQMELQRVYGTREVEFDASDIDVSYISDARIDPRAPELDVRDLPEEELVEIDLSRYLPEDEPDPGYV